jgi:hypothetical protein
MEFSKAPERINADNVVFPTRKLIFMMMNTMMAVSIEEQANARPPAVRVDLAISQNLSFNNGPQRFTRAVIDNFYVNSTFSFEQNYDVNLAERVPKTGPGGVFVFGLG